MNGSVLFYVQHLVGIGHLRRALNLVEALAAEGLAVTLVSGGEPLPDLAGAAARVVQLAPIRARDAGFRALVGGDGRPVDDALRERRRTTLLDAAAAAEPDAVIVEAFPFGRRAFRFELDPLIAAAREGPKRTLVLCSLRDIVVAPEEAGRRQAIVARVHTDFDAILVHGDPTLVPLEASFPEASEIADRLMYTGYVTAAKSSALAENRAGGGVLVSAGGGAMGGTLLAAAVEARRRGCLANRGWRLLTGPNLPESEFSALAAGLPAGVTIERYRRDFPQLLRHCRVSVSQAGYNTVLDILKAQAAAVLVPFAEMRESEQTLRAETLAARGLVELLSPDELSPERLAAAIERAARRRPVHIPIDLGGARRTAHLVVAMIRDRFGAQTRAIYGSLMSPGDYTLGR
jgi:predicted glycosyltransferase